MTGSSPSQHVIFLGKELSHICSGQLSLLPTGWKMSTSFCWGLNPVVHLWGLRVICGAAYGAVNTTYASTACKLPTNAVLYACTAVHCVRSVPWIFVSRSVSKGRKLYP